MMKVFSYITDTILLTQAALNSLTTNCQHLHASCFLAGKHLLRFLTFCQRDVPRDGQDDIESDGDQLLYVDPVTYLTVPRLPEHLIITYCHISAKPPSPAASPSSQIYSKQEMELGVPNTLICFVNDFHPPVVDITWTKKGQLVDQSEISQTQLLQQRLQLPHHVLPELHIYSCSVHHISLQIPLTRFWVKMYLLTCKTFIFLLKYDLKHQQISHKVDQKNLIKQMSQYYTTASGKNM
uniref:Ig-like domain-containing protein n=1 Tax=Amphiprion ocellaris TaxID=80972 RepID=A0A3Q1BM54_AMPOC